MKDSDLFAEYVRRLAPRPTGMRPQMHLRAQVHAVVFAVYGTLFISKSVDITRVPDSSRAIEAMEQLLRSHGIQENAEDFLGRISDAVNAALSQKRAEGIDYPEARIDRIFQDVLATDDRGLARRLALGFELIANPPYPMPDLDELLVSCRRAGLKLGLISNAQFYTPLLFQHFFGRPPRDLGFDAKLILYSYTFGMAKPAADLFEKAAHRLQEYGISRESVLYVGNDMLCDIYPAHQAGFQTALFAGDKRSLRLRQDDPRCRNLAPDAVITGLGQLRRMI
ncbi:MAG: HAD family hydrolase [Desulfobacterales bacterium]